MSPDKSVIKQKKITYWLLFALLFFSYMLMRDSDWHGSTEFHTLLETVATILSFIVGILALLRFYSKKNNTFLFIGTGFLSTGFLDGYHGVVTSTWFVGLFISLPDHLLPWSWVASRLFLSAFMLLSLWAWRKEFNATDRQVINERLVYLFTSVFTMMSFLFFVFVPLPRAYYPELFFGRPQEFIPALFFLLALLGYLRKGGWKKDPFEHWLVLSLIVGFMGQAMFMSFSYQLFDFEFDAAHLLKKVSYIFVLIGLFISIYKLFLSSEKQKKDLKLEVAFRCRAEKKLKNTNTALSKSNRDLQRFAYIASHDLKEPLRGIHNFSSFLIEDYSDKLGNDGEKKLKTLGRLAQRIELMINALLYYTRIDEHGFENTKTNFNEIIENLKNSILETKNKKNVEFYIDNNLPQFYCDKARVTEVFHNLILNAIEFNDNDRKLIKIGYKANNELRLSDSPSHTFYIKDNGVGIKEKYFERIFVIFKRLNGRENYGSGIGAGLTISKKIIEKHGGEIWLESKMGKGSTFFFTIKEQNINN
ncbi:MAG: hypothetical protein D8M58_14725 [Calditrichaeota bacterium]|nr:MAG: hypothetical protein DWQ03_15965 [Calditrichota bacterium]MBL1206657.1 hypothetical protein [Calditrichota bacterium]NOG46484.1 hypothetical protein [Calditrichota bacterium]